MATSQWEQQQQQQRHHQQQLRKAPSCCIICAEDGSNAWGESTLICLEPCGHQVACAECLHKWISKQCSQSRTPTTDDDNEAQRQQQQPFRVPQCPYCRQGIASWMVLALLDRRSGVFSQVLHRTSDQYCPNCETLMTEDDSSGIGGDIHSSSKTFTCRGCGLCWCRVCRMTCLPKGHPWKCRCDAMRQLRPRNPSITVRQQNHPSNVSARRRQQRQIQPPQFIQRSRTMPTTRTEEATSNLGVVSNGIKAIRLYFLSCV